MEYLQKAASSITTFEAYLIEDDLHGDEMVLRKIIETNRSGGVSTNPSETKTCWPETLTKISLLSGFRLGTNRPRFGAREWTKLNFLSINICRVERPWGYLVTSGLYVLKR